MSAQRVAELKKECSARRTDGTGNVDRFLDDYCATFGSVETEADWTVYHMEPHQEWSDHHSLYLQGDNDAGVIIEANLRGGARAGKEGAFVAARTVFFDPDVHGKLTKIRLGCARKSGSSIIHTALDIAREMKNDCTEEDYCSKLSKEFGCSELSLGPRGGQVMSTITSAALGMYKMFSCSRSVTRDKKKA